MPDIKRNKPTPNIILWLRMYHDVFSINAIEQKLFLADGTLYKAIKGKRTIASWHVTKLENYFSTFGFDTATDYLTLNKNENEKT
jgi:hypothetical protein